MSADMFYQYEWRPRSDPRFGTDEGAGWFHANSVEQALQQAERWGAELRRRLVASDWEPFDPQTDDGAAVAAQSMGGSLPPAVPSSLTEDGAATPPADQTGQQVPQHLGSGTAAESATGAGNTAGAPSSSTGPGPAATIGGQPGPDSPVWWAIRPTPRVFELFRHYDKSGVSGTGVVAYGAEFPDGSVALRWPGPYPSTAVWASVEALLEIHGHQGATEVRWVATDAPSDLWPTEGGEDRG